MNIFNQQQNINQPNNIQFPTNYMQKRFDDTTNGNTLNNQNNFHQMN